MSPSGALDELRMVYLEQLLLPIGTCAFHTCTVTVVKGAVSILHVL